ncbi:hypothetical protein [Rhizobium rhizogenes]|uniref:hypothetical protein n=1 Tax=Rhizobium rhizogenes TaxID=359 RepID=UPI0022C4D35D|nr:hypothetical protein [Rhizobium rhizogenes]MCZ7488218.1 hypothetical protein [Rhizobium rhizogenes]
MDEIIEALEACEEYFDNRADADLDQDGYIPNDEMLLLMKVREALAACVFKAIVDDIAAQPAAE